MRALILAAVVAATPAAAEVPVPRPNPAREAPSLSPPPPPTVRAPTCPDRAAVAARLLDGFSERRVAAGLRQDGVLLELYASRSGSWTAVITRPDGTSCMVGSGEGWRMSPFAALGRDGA